MAAALEFGGLHGLVNCAASRWERPSADGPFVASHPAININLIGTT